MNSLELRFQKDKMAESHRLTTPRKILIKDLNTCLTCTLCGGYLIDATTIVDCTHTFCRACIVRHFESSLVCPRCETLVHKSKPLSKLRSDPTLQSLVYKVVPALYSKELQRRSDFYHSTGFRANSSCSDDSVLGDRSQDGDEWANSNIGDPSLYFSPDDSISLSVEYFTKEEDLIDSSNNNNSIENKTSDTKSASDDKTSSGEVGSDTSSRDLNSDVSADLIDSLPHKRYLQCPAAVKMSHLMKFVRMKFALSNEHRVDIIYAGEVLPPYLSLMDVAYTFKWNRLSSSNKESTNNKLLIQAKPMRFFYLIYIPVLRPVVPQEPTESPPELPPPIPPLKIEIPNNKVELTSEKSPKKIKEIKIKEPIKPEEEKKEDNNNKISPKIKPDKVELKFPKSVKFVDNSKSVEYKIKTNDTQGSITENCVYEYAEPDKDEIKAFAERRDREWALQKYPEVHVSKKRKKSKHSKNEFMHKKRKLHAEITSNESLSNTDDSLKLKVKFSVANGHKHKHRSSSSIATIEPTKPLELSPKERLLQMRQVRHKPVPNPDEKTKNPSSEPNLKMVITSEKVDKPEVTETAETSPKPAEKTPDILATGKTLRSDFSNKTSLSKDICKKFVRVSLEKFGEKSPQKKSPINNINKEKEIKNEGKTEIIPIETKQEKINKITETLSIKPADKPNGSKFIDKVASKIIDNKLKIQAAKQSDVKINNVIETKITKQEQKLTKQIDKINFKPIETKLNKDKIISRPPEPKIPPKVLSPKLVQKPEPKPLLDESKVIENKLNNIDFQTSQSNTLVTKNFTVSKVEMGQKRKLETPEMTSDKRPSLEITVINLVSRPQTSSVQTAPVQTKPIAQTKSVSITPEGPPAKKIRPPPLTIPLGRIQKMNNMNKMQKPSEKCDIFGALDLSAKPTTKPEAKPDFRANSGNAKTKMQDLQLLRPKTPLKPEMKDPKSLDKVRPNISNLQMLSESAVQLQKLMASKGSINSIPNLIKKIPPSITQNKTEFIPKTNFTKTPNLIPKSSPLPKPLNNFPQKPPNFVSKNLQKLPNLKEINKGQFCRLNSSQVRPPRPAGQNQTIRNIPNPSLLVRQQNQNRINSLSTVEEKPKTPENTEPEKKTSEPPPLKPIESFKK